MRRFQLLAAFGFDLAGLREHAARVEARRISQRHSRSGAGADAGGSDDSAAGEEGEDAGD